VYLSGSGRQYITLSDRHARGRYHDVIKLISTSTSQILLIAQRHLFIGR